MHIGAGQNSALLSWVGTEPALGSLRSLASKNNWPQEGVGFLILYESELKTAWRPLPPDPSEEALKVAMAMDSLFALPERYDGHPLAGAFWMALGARLGLQPLHRFPGMVLARLETRREKVADRHVAALKRALLKSEASGLVIQMDL